MKSILKLAFIFVILIVTAIAGYIALKQDQSLNSISDEIVGYFSLYRTSKLKFSFDSYELKKFRSKNTMKVCSFTVVIPASEKEIFSNILYFIQRHNNKEVNRDHIDYICDKIEVTDLDIDYDDNMTVMSFYLSQDLNSMSGINAYRIEYYGTKLTRDILSEYTGYYIYDVEDKQHETLVFYNEKELFLIGVHWRY